MRRADSFFFAAVGVWCAGIIGVAAYIGIADQPHLPKPYPVAIWHRNGLFTPHYTGSQLLQLAKNANPQTAAFAREAIAGFQVSGVRKAIPKDASTGLATLTRMCGSAQDRSLRGRACFDLENLRDPPGDENLSSADLAQAQQMIARGIEAGSARATLEGADLFMHHPDIPIDPLLRRAAGPDTPETEGLESPAIIDTLLHLGCERGYSPECYIFAIDLLQASLRDTSDPARAQNFRARGYRWVMTAATLPFASESAERIVGDAWRYGYWGLPKSIDEAVTWYRKASHDGSARATMALARFYSDGTLSGGNADQTAAWAIAYANAATIMASPHSKLHTEAQNLLTADMQDASINAENLGEKYEEAMITKYPRQFGITKE